MELYLTGYQPVFGFKFSSSCPTHIPIIPWLTCFGSSTMYQTTGDISIASSFKLLPFGETLPAVYRSAGMPAEEGHAMVCEKEKRRKPIAT